jgi:hypothetical protein
MGKPCRWTTRQGVERPPPITNEAHRHQTGRPSGEEKEVSKLLGSGVVDLVDDHTDL